MIMHVERVKEFLVLTFTEHDMVVRTHVAPPQFGPHVKKEDAEQLFMVIFRSAQERMLKNIIRAKVGTGG